MHSNIINNRHHVILGGIALGVLSAIGFLPTSIDFMNLKENIIFVWALLIAGSGYVYYELYMKPRPKKTPAQQPQPQPIPTAPPTAPPISILKQPQQPPPVPIAKTKKEMILEQIKEKIEKSPKVLNSGEEIK